MRGNLSAHVLNSSGSRSIPARAGEPVRRQLCAQSLSVYPRACGGTGIDIGPTPRDCGLSPRVRGNPKLVGVVLQPMRSIPARAGEPAGAEPHGRQAGVYPRACGGTNTTDSTLSTQRGLSPRVRGNHSVLNVVGTFDGSIPARAGEPLYRQNASPLQAGSIPARAGEPRMVRKAPELDSVYPRACGGTAGAITGTISMTGLSPRVRGNRRSRTRRRRWCWSR